MRKELTVRGLIIGIIITLVFTAANVYFGLKAGLTFSTSIPAAVISMAILRGFRDATIQENNIVQTVASAAGTLSSIIFVLPGLIMIGWWTEFPFWTSFWICALGGILGVMYSIPLRRALVTQSDLPYPEGVACAEVLKVGSSDDSKHASDIEHGRAGLLAVLWGSIVAAVFAVVVQTQLFAADVAQTFRIGKRGAVSGYDFFLSFALLGIGHLVGLSVGIAMLIGALMGWSWGDQRFGNLDAVEIGKASRERTRWRHGRVACAEGGQGRHATNYRARYSDWHCWSCHAGLYVANRVAARLFRNGQWSRRSSAHTRHRRRGLHRIDEFLRFRGLWLHGGTDRFVEQSAVGDWHSGCHWRSVVVGGRGEALRRAGSKQIAHGIRALYDSGRFQRCCDCQ